MARWRTAAAGGDTERFAAILRQRGIELDAAQRALSDDAQSGTLPEPAWVLDLRRWLDSAAAAACGRPPDWASATGPPGSEFLWPLVVACEDQLRARSAAPMLRTPAVRQALQLMLARWIGNIAAAAVAEQRAGGALPDIAGFMIAYPVLARLLTTVAESWSAAMVEFAERCEADHDLLAHNFAGGAPLGQPVAVALDLSDPHNGLRTVAAITFASGIRLVYKPRSLAMDIAFADFLDALNATGQLPDLRAPRTLERPGYGWCEWIEDRAPADAAEWDALCARTGALLAIVFLLEGVDIHDENIVFAGRHPVIVDAETMLHPRYGLVPLPAKLGSGLATAWRGLQLSVRRTLMVSERSSSGGIWQDSAAISTLAARWLAAGLSPDEFVARVTAGFEAGMRALGRLGQDQATVDRLLAPFASCRARVVVRPTSRYQDIFVQSLKAECLRDGTERSLALERLAADLTTENGPRLPSALLDAELAALAQGDIPYFTGAVEKDEIQGFAGLAGTCSLGQARLNLAEAERLTEGEARVLEGSLRARLAPIACIESVEAKPQAPIAPGTLEAAALGIVKELLSALCVADDGSFGAVGIGRDPGGTHHQFLVLSPGLFRGTVGIGLLLAAFKRFESGADLALLPRGLEVALRTQMQQLRECLGVRSLAKVHGHMAAVTAEAAYGCLRAAQLLGSRSLLSAVKSVASDLAAWPHMRSSLSGAATLALYRCGQAFQDDRVLTEASRRTRAMAERIDDQSAREAAARDPQGLSLLVQLLAVVAEAETDAGLLDRARALSAALPSARFHAPSALVRHRLMLGDPLPERPADDDSVEHGGAGWLELALVQGPEGRNLALAAAGRIVDAAETLGGYALASGRCRRPLCLDLADGLAGVAYQLLRTMRPAELPSILLMD